MSVFDDIRHTVNQAHAQNPPLDLAQWEEDGRQLGLSVNPLAKAPHLSKKLQRITEAQRKEQAQKEQALYDPAPVKPTASDRWKNGRRTQRKEDECP